MRLAHRLVGGLKMQDNLYEKIYDIDNLYLASKKALKGKKSTSSAARFWMDEEKEILKIQKLLKDEKYPFGYYTEFDIYDKGILRKISAAPFKDRVVHHAIMNIIEPIFDKTFIYDTYANRKGKGVSSALYRIKKYAKKYKYYLKIDIQKYFPSIDHEILKGLLRKKVSCVKTLNLLDNLINSSNKQQNALFYYKDDNLFTPYERTKGIPLGNLTSQFFGNLYLNRFDHFATEVLKVKYIRYVDDIVMFSDEKMENILNTAKSYLARFRLQIHPLKICFGECIKGIEMLGHKVFATHIRLKPKNVKMAKRNLTKIKYLYKYNKIDLPKAKNRIFGIIGFMKIGDNYNLSKMLLAQTILSKSPMEAVPPWWQLEQQC